MGAPKPVDRDFGVSKTAERPSFLRLNRRGLRALRALVLVGLAFWARPAALAQTDSRERALPPQGAVERALSLQSTATRRRLALVIGNNAYRFATPLTTAVADAQAVGAQLESAGFETETLVDLDRRSMNRAIDGFVRKLSAGTVAMVFYAGHGIQVQSSNFLIPTDLDAQSLDDIVNDAIELNSILLKITRAGATFSLAVIDACRDDPFQGNQRALSLSAGLAPPTSSPQGFMVVFSAGANEKALDRLSESDRNPNGLFTRELLKVMSLEGVTVQDAVARLKTAVIDQARSVGHNQHPAVYDQSTGPFYFRAPRPRPAIAAAPPAPGVDLSDLEREATVRNEWASYEARLEADFKRASAFEAGPASPDLKASAWERFTSAYARDNPLSTEDDTLRRQAAERAVSLREAGRAPAPPALDLSDLERAAAERAQWSDYQGRMATDFAMARNFDRSDAASDLKLLAWEQFLEEYAKDNPQSPDDDAFRQAAQDRLKTLRLAGNVQESAPRVAPPPAVTAPATAAPITTASVATAPPTTPPATTPPPATVSPATPAPTVAPASAPPAPPAQAPVTELARNAPALPPPAQPEPPKETIEKPPSSSAVTRTFLPGATRVVPNGPVSPEFDGWFEFEISPRSPSIGAPYVVSVFLRNQGRKGVRLDQVTVKEWVDGTQKVVPVRLLEDSVKGGQRRMVTEVKGTWQESSSSWVLEVVATSRLAEKISSDFRFGSR